MECRQGVAGPKCIEDPKRVQEVPSEVIERCRRGEIAALGEIYHHLGARVWHVARNLLGRDADAAYIYLVDRIAPGSVTRTQMCDVTGVAGEINLDIDGDGRLLGVEVLQASKVLPSELLPPPRR